MEILLNLSDNSMSTFLHINIDEAFYTRANFESETRLQVQYLPQSVPPPLGHFFR